MTRQKITRRQMLLATAGGALPFLAGCRIPAENRAHRQTTMGIVTYCFNINRKHDWAGRYAGMAPGLAFLEECHRLGAGGIQFPFGAEDVSSLPEIRRRAEEYGMRVEGIVDVPLNATTVESFEQKVIWARQAGATFARSTILPGRRYEEFKTLEEFRSAETRAIRNLQTVEPVLARQRFRLALENHKDQLVPEKTAMLQKLGSEYIGICVDVGNNIALAEEAMSVVRALAPYAFTVHLKDQVATSCPDGYLLWDAAMGDGFLKLPAMVQVLRAARREVTFNLEVITRDPLKIPVHTEAYWATLPVDRAAAFKWIQPMVRNSPRPSNTAPLASLSMEQQMALEVHNCQTSLVYAREHLRL
jgi:sugar phosphate isomerase/epimerase